MSYRIIRAEGHFPFHVIDSTGLPHQELTLLHALRTGSIRSRPAEHTRARSSILRLGPQTI